MGTRHVTMVILDEKPVIAQYGQWDGYPDGQGATILEFLETMIEKTMREKLAKCRFITPEEATKFDAEIAASDKGLKELFPLLTRDLGAGILQAVYDSDAEEILLSDQSDFGQDEVFCEFAYIIDLDKATFEFYTSWSDAVLDKKDKGWWAKRAKGKDKPILLSRTYSLRQLPTVEDLQALACPETEDA